MKKILSIFMVAVLSLNLYQPCMAANGEKESESYSWQKVLAEKQAKRWNTKKKIQEQNKSNPKISLLGLVYWGGSVFISFVAGALFWDRLSYNFIKDMDSFVQEEADKGIQLINQKTDTYWQKNIEYIEKRRQGVEKFRQDTIEYIEKFRQDAIEDAIEDIEKHRQGVERFRQDTIEYIEKRQKDAIEYIEKFRQDAIEDIEKCWQGGEKNIFNAGNMTCRLTLLNKKSTNYSKK